MGETTSLLTLKEASDWATRELGKEVTQSNISYLIQYAKIKKYNEKNSIKIDISELKDYYQKQLGKQKEWKDKLGRDLNWNLSFDNLREVETTKHVHRLHPYKGKFIPQLVEYFLDNNLNHFKKEIFFKPGNIILDPFVGSGTTLVQAQELGIKSIGIDISEFNCLISKVKTDNYNFGVLNDELNKAFKQTIEFSNLNFDNTHDIELKNMLSEYNKVNFDPRKFKSMVYNKEINEKEYSEEKLQNFNAEFLRCVKTSETREKARLLDEKKMSSFLYKWFTPRIRQELFFYINLIEQQKDAMIKNVMKIILSRTARSCRATTHLDLATLKNPQIYPYYCSKHFKICTPISSVLKHLKKNTQDTIKRLKEFSKLKYESDVAVINGDSRNVDILHELKKQNNHIYELAKNKKLDGIFTSPPYVGHIDYHEQHAYSYELFEIKRRDEQEIGPLFNGSGKKAQEQYINGIAEVFKNVKRFLKDDANIFVVANDKHNLYPTITDKSGLKIINSYKRPVLNRTERSRQPYAETIFHMRNVN